LRELDFQIEGTFGCVEDDLNLGNELLQVKVRSDDTSPLDGNALIESGWLSP